jgi:molybdenum cofactor cytidylyltransferase
LKQVRNSDIGLIVLAAGASTRMGRPKQLLHWRGATLIRRAVATALATDCQPIIVVLGAVVATIQAEIADLDVQIVENANWQQGMSTSIQAGLQYLLQTTPNVNAVLFMLADQPLLTTAHLQKLIAAYRQGADRVASEYQETLAVPALFGRSWLEALQCLRGDQGARALFHQDPAHLVRIPFPEGFFDIDTPEAYHSFLQKFP